MTNKNLPITVFRDKIVEAVRDNPVVVITAETGAGKSTQVPQYLLDEGYNIVVTQPRRLAARSVATRVAEELGGELGETVGYRTAVDRKDSSATRCLFCTDGLALVRELVGQGAGWRTVLVLDEVHEWNENIEVLVAWAKRQIEDVADFKVVLMSATLEAEKLASYFGGAPVISVPGRMFPVEVRKPGTRLEDDVADLARAGRNVLVFQPGKQEIAETCAALKQMQVEAEILPLHGELTPEEQTKCFRHYGRPKVVVSTNVAQTSVTIDDIDAVVDSGMERRVELVDGVEGLYLKPISLADSTQRKGRAGRTKEGVYIDHCPSADRPEFPVAEILRKRLDQTVLRLAIAGFDMEELDFFHQPDKEEIHRAKDSLIKLGLMSEDGAVTKTGRTVARLPVSVQYGRMLVEANRRGVVDDVLTIAAILEAGGIVVPPPSRNRPDRPDWRRMVPSEKESDLMAQLSVWRQMESMSKDEARENGVSLRKFFRAKEIRRHLEGATRRFFQPGSTDRREDILKSVCAGMVDHLYQNKYGSYQNGDGAGREIGSGSVVGGAEWVVGRPFDLQIKTRRGLMTLKLIEMVSKVDPRWLAEVAPQLVATEAGLNPRYDSREGCVVSTTRTLFDGVVIAEETVPDPDHPEAPRILDERVWTEWEKPEIPVPDFSLAGELPAEVPEIREEVYAISRIDGRPLSAYGVVSYSWGWGSKWTRDREEAERLREQAEKKLAELRKKKTVRDRIERELDSVNRRRETIGLSLVEMRESNFSHDGWSQDYTEENWNRVLEETADREAEAAAERARAEKEAEEARLVEAGAFTGFAEIWCRRGGSNQGDGWVIRPDGSFREHDSMDNPRPRYPSEGYKSWNIVRPEDVAISWRKATRASAHEFEVTHLPEYLTAEQVKAMENLLEELEATWDGATGLASGEPSPSVGDGWVNPETGESLTKGFLTSRQKRELQEAERRKREAEKEQAEKEAEKMANSPFVVLTQLKGKLG